jgi:DNA-binding IscR family transcriptional regulator
MERLSSSMQLTRGADYAVRALIHLAGLPRGSRIMLPALARITEAPDDFLYKILQALRRAGFVSRGAASMADLRFFQPAEMRR